jgi:hypothetical protein
MLSLFAGMPDLAAQGTAFTYQGRLNDGSSPATGAYDFRFRLAADPLGNTYVGSAFLSNGVPVSGGLFTVTMDFGNQFTGSNYWLEADVRTNGAAGYTTLFPLQALTPSAYAIFANTASNLSGTLPAGRLTGTVSNGQLANSSVTVNAGAGLSGGGTAALGGSIGLNNAGVLSVAGNADITANTVGGAVTLGDTGTSANTPSTIVKRDSGGNFSAGTISLNANLNLPATTATAGIIYSGGSTLLHTYGAGNFFGGAGAGNLTLSGNVDTAVGSDALHNDTGGSANAAFGSQALYSNTSGNVNTAIGYQALYSNTNGAQNTANGAQALFFNTSGSGNTANGFGALFYNTNGYGNAANGASALYNNTSGFDNTANGFVALYGNTSGYFNTANGYQALYSNTNGHDNAANGAFALHDNTSGYGNTATGNGALYSNTGGFLNTANGNQALYFSTNGTYNVADGAQALYWNTSGNYNTASGAQALNSNTSGLGNSASGYEALYHNIGGSYNLADGYQALLFFTNGNYNIALGYSAGLNVINGSFNIDIGSQGVAGENNTIHLGTQGTQTSAFIAGIYGVTAASGVPVYINTNGQLGTVTSSARFKQDIQSMEGASDVLLSLRPVTFQYKPELDPNGIRQFGLIAEEVDKVDPDLVARDDKNQIYTVRYEAVNAMLLNEFLKQHRKVQKQSAEIEQLKQRLDKLERALAPQTTASTR